MHPREGRDCPLETIVRAGAVTRSLRTAFRDAFNCFNGDERLGECQSREKGKGTSSSLKQKYEIIKGNIAIDIGEREK